MSPTRCGTAILVALISDWKPSAILEHASFAAGGRLWLEVSDCAPHPVTLSVKSPCSNIPHWVHWECSSRRSEWIVSPNGHSESLVLGQNPQ